MTVGEKIRKFRIDQGYTQKELAIMSGLSESAIRNYELGNRFPSSEQLEKIANSLKISPYAMSDPNFDTYVSVMHALFALEDQYGLHAYRDESGVQKKLFTIILKKYCHLIVNGHRKSQESPQNRHFLALIYYSNSTITNQFCLEIICCRVRFSFNYLIYPYYPAYTS